MGSTRGLAACFEMMGGLPSPPIALEGSREMRAEKVSSIEIDREPFQETVSLKDLGTERMS